MTRKTVLALLSVMFIILVTGCRTESSNPAPAVEKTKTAAGVILHFSKSSDPFSDGGGWLENTNSYPVRIKGVWVSARSETTIAIDSVASGGKVKVKEISRAGDIYTYRYCAYIYKDGAEVGYLDSEVETNTFP